MLCEIRLYDKYYIILNVIHTYIKPNTKYMYTSTAIPINCYLT